MSTDETRDRILSFWQEQARLKGPAELVTHRDHNQVSLEISIISSMLHSDDVVLDVGCGNGFSSAAYCQGSSFVTGVDYSPNMISSANNSYRFPNLAFSVCDILSPSLELEAYSVVISTRCLINLTNWDDQQRAIRNIHALLKPGGRFIMAEGIKQGRDNLNQLRVASGLEPLPPVWHNLDFDEEQLFPFLEGMFVVRQDVRFGLYDVLTRVNYPACISPEEPQYGTIFQAVAERMERQLPVASLNKYSREACLELVKI